MQVRTNNPGLAQFMRSGGAQLIAVDENKQFIFETDKKKKEWQFAYVNSDYPSFVAGVSELINLIKVN